MVKSNTEAELIETVKIYTQCLAEGFKQQGGSPSAVVETARRQGLKRSTVNNRLGAAARRGITANTNPSPDVVQMPDFPDEDLSTEELIAHMKRRFLKKKASHDAHTWFPIKVKDNLPFALVFFGDPHVDDNGCNWPELERHINVCQAPGVYGVNVGDSTNNWTGRLMRLYAQQSTSVQDARKLVQWLMLESGVKWLVWILGNHDTWNDGAEILVQMGKRYGTKKLICHDWEARFCLEFKNGWSPRIFVAHNFKGVSMWNPAHGPMREGQMGEVADVYVCGDLHQSIDVGFENAARGVFQRFIRVRGFKFMDEHARRLGYKEQQEGCSAMVIFDPQRQTIQTFMDVEEGGRYLQWKRGGK